MLRKLSFFTGLILLSVAISIALAGGEPQEKETNTETTTYTYEKHWSDSSYSVASLDVTYDTTTGQRVSETGVAWGIDAEKKAVSKYWEKDYPKGGGVSEEERERELGGGGGSPSPTPPASPPPTPTFTPPPSPSLTFTANPSSIVRGETSRLSWSSNADSCIADCISGDCVEWDANPAIGLGTYTPTSGSQAVSPDVTATYRLSCFTTAGGFAQAEQTISVGQIKWREIIPRLPGLIFFSRGFAKE